MTSGRCCPPTKMRSVVSAIATVAAIASDTPNIATNRILVVFIVSSSAPRAGLCQAGVDDQIMPGNAARLIRGEEQHAARHVVFVQPELEALLGEKFALELGREPQRALARRVD